MRVDHVLPRGALVEVGVALRRLVERDHRDIAGFRGRRLFVKDGLHELPVIRHHRALTGREVVRLRPTESDADAEVADLGVVIDAAGVARDVQARDADAAARTDDFHQRVEDRGGPLDDRVLAVAARLEPHAVHAAIDFGNTDDLVDLLGERRAFPQIDGLAAEAFRLGEPLGNQIADDDAGRAQKLATVGACQSDRAAARDVDDRARPHARGDGSVVTRGEDIGEQGQVFDLRHGLIPVRELQQVEVGVGHHHVFGLSADPAAHVDVAVRGARTGGVNVQADAGLAFLAVAAAPAGDIERHRDDVADADELDVSAGLDHLACDFVAEDEARGSGRASANHVLVAAADS